ncbi:hypothetical protein B0T26DRAFT_806743 [Lasiosphaeria miniovina]|uniref:Zn(2)-C6 fungal-type domain-containing protein n=1 Tax=Lasiosphaeria miniovina TaxID=1954250 RepID=A0AA40DMZ3_9PEZI|nr:uncharacterized protein B0T26DRAFT_806743 [Lasiosphaeria miniovina]KAK0707151.1 hypothetical protein B0T26DRAFT_806743 [Lasiosphaeria miniovina]
MPSCMRCREKSLTCRAPPNAKRCAECTRAGNMRCGLNGPDYRALQSERALIEAAGEEAISLDEEAAALQAAAAAKFAERSAAAAAEFAAESAAAAEKRKSATARRRRVQRQRAAFQAKIAKIFSHEDAAIAELEEEERNEEARLAPEAALVDTPAAADWGQPGVDYEFDFRTPEPLPAPSASG